MKNLKNSNVLSQKVSAFINTTIDIKIKVMLKLVIVQENNGYIRIKWLRIKIKKWMWEPTLSCLVVLRTSFHHFLDLLNISYSSFL
jgi:hypothetical protein